MTRKPEPLEQVAARNRKASAAKSERGMVRRYYWAPRNKLEAVKAAIKAELEKK